MRKPKTESSSRVRPVAGQAQAGAARTAKAAVRSGNPRGRGRPRTEDVEHLEAQLLAAAQEMFGKHGYGATSMAALARAAKVSKTTLYGKFSTKAVLFRAIVEQQGENAYRVLRKIDGSRHKTLASSLQHMAEQTFIAATSREVLQITRLIEWESPRFPELGEASRARARLGIELFASHIRAFAAKEDRPCRDPDGAAEILNFLLRGLYQSIRMEDQLPAMSVVRRKIRKVIQFFMASRANW